MTDDRDEQRLREAFQDLRADARTGGRAPAFGPMLAEAKRRVAERPELDVVAGGGGSVRRRPRWLVRVGAGASVAIAAAVAALILVDQGPSGDADFEQLVAAYSSQVGGGALSSPTSGLLDVPGMDLMRSVPSIGAPVRGIDPSSLPAPEPSSEEENL